VKVGAIAPPEQELYRMKKIAHIAPAPARHWVGDGFPVHNMFGYGSGADLRSPFLMLDYGAATRFEPNPTPQRRGVGSHPHRGFETVTIVYDGEVEHRDSTGGGGVIGPGDVQWMTAGGGILHDEFHSEATAGAAARSRWCSCGSTCPPRTR
jgi:redox-sensitive bicupin YhaK (pirin superfamily)